MMANAQSRRQVSKGLEIWWDNVHPYAVQLESCITESPESASEHDTAAIIKTLYEISHDVKALNHTHDCRLMRDTLLRAVHYLIHAYEENKREQLNESQFYYSSALTQIAQFHYLLVQNGFID